MVNGRGFVVCCFTWFVGGGFVCALEWAHVVHWFEVFVLCVIVNLLRSSPILIVSLWFMGCSGVPVALLWVLF